MTHIQDTGSESVKDFFIARQPILNRKNNIVAYELLFRAAAASTESGVTDDLFATSSVISHAVELSLPRVIGSELAFINVDAKMIMSDFINFLPAKSVILEILETVEITAPLITRIAELRSAGYTFALDDVIENTVDIQLVLPLISIIKIDISGMDAATIYKLAEGFQKQKKKLLAEKVETRAQRKICYDAGFDYFQGYYFSKPDIISGKKMPASQSTISKLLNMIDNDASAAEIEHVVKHDTALIISLLRIVNTPAAGVGFKITSLRQALLTIGNRQLRRWLQILLFATPTAFRSSSPLLVYASSRGKLMELLSHRVQSNVNADDIAFTTGIMSLLPALFDIPIDSILRQIPVDPEIAAALLTRDNLLGKLLTIAENSERTDSPLSELIIHLNELGISIDEFNYMQLAAHEWSRALASVSV